MLYPKLTAVVTALVLFGGTQAGRAEYDLSQLRIIEQHIASRDCGALLQYFLDNPRIMAGNDPLAQELRSFVEGVGGGLIDCLSAPQVGGNFGANPDFGQIY